MAAGAAAAPAALAPAQSAELVALPHSVARGLSDKLYDRRKAAALEIEALVKGEGKAQRTPARLRAASGERCLYQLWSEALTPRRRNALR